jgi:hypothetical protein
MGDSEDIQANPFFALLQSTPIFAACARQQLIVCIPAAESLSLLKKDKELLESHVFRSTDRKDEYVTLNQRSVSFKDNTLITGSGFVIQRTVPVTMQELYYDENYESFQVLRVSYPLIGKVPMAYLQALQDQVISAVPVEKRSLREHEGIIMRVVGMEVGNQMMAARQRFLREFTNTYIMVKGFQSKTGSKIKEACTKMVQEAIATAAKVPGQEKKVKSWSNRVLCELQVAVETCVMADTHKKVFMCLTEFFIEEEAKLSKMIHEYDYLTMTDLGIRAQLHKDYSQPIRKMVMMSMAVTPIHKMNCLAEIADTITDVINNDNQSNNSNQGGDVICADDMVILMVYLILQSKISHIYANLEFMDHFRPSDINSVLNLSNLNMHFANFLAAVRFIESGKLASMGMHASGSSSSSSGVSNGSRSRKGSVDESDVIGELSTEIGGYMQKKQLGQRRHTLQSGMLTSFSGLSMQTSAASTLSLNVSNSSISPSNISPSSSVSPSSSFSSNEFKPKRRNPPTTVSVSQNISNSNSNNSSHNSSNSGNSNGVDRRPSFSIPNQVSNQAANQVVFEDGVSQGDRPLIPSKTQSNSQQQQQQQQPRFAYGMIGRRGSAMPSMASQLSSSHSQSHSHYTDSSSRGKSNNFQNDNQSQAQATMQQQHEMEYTWNKLNSKFSNTGVGSNSSSSSHGYPMRDRTDDDDEYGSSSLSQTPQKAQLGGFLASLMQANANVITGNIHESRDDD